MAIFSKKTTDLLYLTVLASVLFWFAYTKGWILANFDSINAKEAITLLENDENVILLDVRTIKEYKKGHLQGATLIPLYALEANLGMLKRDKEKKIIVYCQSGNRSVAASRILEKKGFTPLNVKGGISALIKANAQIAK